MGVADFVPNHPNNSRNINIGKRHERDVEGLVEHCGAILGVQKRAVIFIGIWVSNELHERHIERHRQLGAAVSRAV